MWTIPQREPDLIKCAYSLVRRADRAPPPQQQPGSDFKTRFLGLFVRPTPATANCTKEIPPKTCSWDEALVGHEVKFVLGNLMDPEDQLTVSHCMQILEVLYEGAVCSFLISFSAFQCFCSPFSPARALDRTESCRKCTSLYTTLKFSLALHTLSTPEIRTRPS